MARINRTGRGPAITPSLAPVRLPVEDRFGVPYVDQTRAKYEGCLGSVIPKAERDVEYTWITAHLFHVKTWKIRVSHVYST